jgi:spermidine/putrescine transport system permease protein
LFSACAITLAMSLDDFIITNLINGSFQTLSTAIYSTRKGIKAWVITFGSIVVLTTFIIVIFTTIYKISKNKNNYKFHHKKENK